jgi:hypothetical protein
MKRYIFALIFPLAFLAPSFALAQPGIPHQFYGTVTLAGTLAPDGTTVQIKVNGTVVGTTQTSGGKYGYAPNVLFAEKSEGEWSGETAKFFVGGTEATTAILSRGGYTKLDLTVTTQTSSGGSGGGGGGSSGSSSTSTSGDANNDGKVDKFDFALLMANWGKTSTNVADLNNDGIVNKYDFALLMLHWTI